MKLNTSQPYEQQCGKPSAAGIQILHTSDNCILALNGNSRGFPESSFCSWPAITDVISTNES